MPSCFWLTSAGGVEASGAHAEKPSGRRRSARSSVRGCRPGVHVAGDAVSESPEKIEVMVNKFCHKGCPHRQEHYMRNSQDQLDGVMRPFSCTQPPTTAFFRP